ncbi:hypothetical protein HETIRDRAFT_119912 [Heterobasidion irregulare TC 32-1]|uniref:Uncharacterized protein n=1 Tax=Heterobasidion irregulare (strain TC 32-1) TaxID=747525 RepID=W4JYG2_HETIT|nr:uncharacterized protein HETIRDRAFT_119912 [Heterobasidion irregulare TC 32-1]ETW77896.1 hypothetical protein HETIRDRAFT_119912 [Heterobasidion irregulare TC 32-1]
MSRLSLNGIRMERHQCKASQFPVPMPAGRPSRPTQGPAPVKTSGKPMQTNRNVRHTVGLHSDLILTNHHLGDGKLVYSPSMPVSLPPIQSKMGNQRSVLCNANPNVRDDPDIVITELLLLREGRRKEVYRDIFPRIDVINAFVDLASPSITSPRQKTSIALVLLSLSCEDAMEECERKMKVEINAIEPHPYKFGRKELHRLCNELNLWKPFRK